MNPNGVPERFARRAHVGCQGLLAPGSLSQLIFLRPEGGRSCRENSAASEHSQAFYEQFGLTPKFASISLISRQRYVDPFRAMEEAS